MKDHEKDPSLDMLLKIMRVPSILEQYHEVAGIAEREGWDFIRFLKELVTIEIEGRLIRKLERIQRQSHLPEEKTLASFDLSNGILLFVIVVDRIVSE